MATSPNYGAFMEKFVLPPNPLPDLPLHSLTFAVKDMFNLQGRLSSFGNPDWKRTHSVSLSTAPTISSLLNAGGACVGSLVMDEMAFSIMGENIHYGTPRNPCAADRIPGGSSSGSAVAAGAKLVDFSIGTDCTGSSRIPAAFCGTFGIRPSYGIISESGVIPMAQSLDTVGWFTKDPTILSKVGGVLLQLPSIIPVRPTKIIIADDCFQISSIPYDAHTQIIIKAIEKLYGGDLIQHINLGDYVMANVPSLKDFMSKMGLPDNAPLPALSSAMQLIERFEFKNNHGEWITTVKPHFGPRVAKNVAAALKTTGENIDICHAIALELRHALADLLGDFGALMIPTVPGPPPKLLISQSEYEDFCAKAFTLVSVAGLSGSCQVSIPLGMYNNLPISVSLVAKYGADGFLLPLVESIYARIKEKELALA